MFSGHNLQENYYPRITYSSGSRFAQTPRCRGLTSKATILHGRDEQSIEGTTSLYNSRCAFLPDRSWQKIPFSML